MEMTNAMGYDFLSGQKRVEARLWKSRPFSCMQDMESIECVIYGTWLQLAPGSAH